MKTHLYLTCSRTEALIASQLEPAEFGTYMAVGTEKLTVGQLMFFEINPDLKSDYFDLARARRECVPHPGGRPKASLYISIYRAMEHVSLPDYGTLYLVTRDGRVLGISPQGYSEADESSQANLYQELCPVSPLIVSSLPPGAFCQFITDPQNAVHVPRIFFADLRVDRDRDGRLAGTLPYAHPKHIESCIQELEQGKGKKTKTVDREHPMRMFYRTVRRGFYLGDQTGVKSYPFPSPDELDDKHHIWWKSASMG
jgi:hypothetical protein